MKSLRGMKTLFFKINNDSTKWLGHIFPKFKENDLGVLSAKILAPPSREINVNL